MVPCRLVIVSCLLVWVAASASAQVEEGLRTQSRLPIEGVKGSVPGRVEDVRTVGALMSAPARSKFREPADTDEVVDKEFLVTFASNTPPAVINQVAGQVQASSAGVDFRLLGNQVKGWKGLAFKVPDSYTPQQTAALLDSLLVLPGVESSQANNFMQALRHLTGNTGAPTASRDLLQVKGVKPIRPPPPGTPTPPPGTSPPPPPSSCPTVTPTPSTTQSVDANLWGLDRIHTPALPLDGVYQYSSNGSDANVFVVDTGVQADHPELVGRVTAAFDYYNQGAADYDGHGTHCAGTIGGTTTGVAKGVNIHAVRVLDANGRGTNTAVIAGINFVANSPLPRRIISMSLGGGTSTALNNAVAAATRAGVLSVVAAGNSNGNACRESPASAPSAITVAASDWTDYPASFSNWGTCVDIWAPGVKIYSTYPPSTYMVMSGTSMATPHVAGVVARLWSKGVCTTNLDCANALKCLAASNKMQGSLRNAPNLLLNIPPGV